MEKRDFRFAPRSQMYIDTENTHDRILRGNDDTRMRLWKIQPKKAEISIEPLCTAGLHTDWIHSATWRLEASVNSSGCETKRGDLG